MDLEKHGYAVIPTAKATRITMNREGIRILASEKLKLKTSPYQFASDQGEFIDAVRTIGFPCIVKPIMSSSGKGQSLIRNTKDLKKAWTNAQVGGRAGKGKVIVEGFVDFDYEITLLTIRHAGEKGEILTSFCEPIGHRQVNGDYRESWQPQPMNPKARAEAEHIGKEITAALGGRGVFGVELFVKGDEVYFSEVSPRPHDTGMVTMISQNLSEFALHARAILGLPIPNIRQNGPSASSVILAKGDSKNIQFENLGIALSQPDTQLRLFGKPEVNGYRRMGVALALDETLNRAREKAEEVASVVKVQL